jgi:hypothetical protein
LGLADRGGVVKYTISMKDLEKLESKIFEVSSINEYSKENPAILKDYRAVGGSGAFRHIGFVEKTLEEQLNAFIDKLEDYDSAVRCVERDVQAFLALLKKRGSMDNHATKGFNMFDETEGDVGDTIDWTEAEAFILNKIKRNERLARSAIDKLGKSNPAFKEKLLKLLEEK